MRGQRRRTSSTSSSARPARSPHALLVVARDHLADQPEREELHADHDEQDAEHQQRALPDRVPERLEHGQVDEDRRPDEAEEQAEAAEQMQRPVAVAADEGHGEQIEEAAQVALHAVARAPVLARRGG